MPERHLAFLRDLGEEYLRLLRLRFPDGVPNGQTPAAPGPAQPVLQRVHRKLLSVATGTPQTARALVRAAGYKFNSHSRSALTWLCREGLLVRDAWSRYALPPTARGQAQGTGAGEIG